MVRYVASRALLTGVKLRITDAAFRDFHGYVVGVDEYSVVLANRPDPAATDRVTLVPTTMARQFGVMS